MGFDTAGRSDRYRESPIGKTPDMDSINLYANACLEAVDDAGLEKADIDGLVTWYSLVDRS